MRESALILFVVSIIMMGIWGPASDLTAAEFRVTKTADTNDGSCESHDCSLREAIIAANASEGTDSILIPAGRYFITLAGSDENASATGDLDITGPVILAGDGMGETIINGLGMFGVYDRVFHVLAPNSDVRFENLGIYAGYAHFSNLFSVGGGVLVDLAGTVEFHRCHLYGNSASIAGGGIYSVSENVWQINLVECLVEKNESATGGGIMAGWHGLGIDRSTLTNNSAGSTGGGLVVWSSLVGILNSTFYHNSSPVGAEISAYNSLVGVEHSTLAAENVFASDGPSILVNGGTGLFFYNSIVWGNCDTDGEGAFGSLGRNMGDPARTCGCDHSTDLFIPDDPRLMPLGDYGGPTPTAPPYPRSAAVDRRLTITDPPPTDQRGVPRPQEGNGDALVDYDIGAVEYKPPDLPDDLRRRAPVHPNRTIYQ